MSDKKFNLKILGMYLPNNRKVYPMHGDKSNVEFTSEGNAYLPILNLFQFNTRDEVVFSNGLSVSDEVITYNSNSSTQSLDKSVILNSKIDISENDLLAGPIQILLNLTTRHIVLVDSDGLKKTFVPIANTKFAKLQGRVLVFKVHTFNNPYTITQLNGYTNYFEKLAAKYKDITSHRYYEMKAVLNYLSERFKNSTLKREIESSNCIKVVTLSEVLEETLVSNKVCYIPSKDICLCIDDILSAPNHTNANAITETGDLKEYIRANSFVCYIIDNEDILNDRYVNIAGTVTKLGKFKNSSAPNGLYMIITDSTGRTTQQSICSIEDIDSNKYIYKNMEEAKEGADIKTKYKDDLDMTRLDMEKSRLELERLKTEKDREILKLKQEYEERTKKMNYEFEQRSLNNKSDHEERKYSYDVRSLSNKTDYEERKYTRDSTVETLKTIGIVGSLIGTGVLLFGKYSK